MEERDRRGPGARQVEVPGLSPVRAFLVVCTIATVLGGAFFATRDASPSEPPVSASPRSPDYSLTDTEAIAEFERLHDLQVRAYEERDLSLVPRVYTSDSPIRERAEKEITTLLRKNVTTTTRFATKRLTVSENSADELVLHQSVVVDASFFNSRGREISLDAPAELQEIHWTLRLEDHVWRIHDAVIVASRPVERGKK